MQIDPADAPSAVIHLYRGELGRMTLYRVRLDTTTNWAVGTSAAMVSFGLGKDDAPHLVFALAALLDVVFLLMEARRFRYYEMISERVRLLEKGFYGDVLGENPGDEGWEERIRASIREPHMPVTLLEAVSLRLRRNYAWLFFAVYVAWLGKLTMVGPDLVSAASAGPIPGLVVLGLSAACLVPVIGLAFLFTYRPSEEE